MKSRPLADQSSWRFFAAIHGIYYPLWEALGYFHGNEAMPPVSARRQFWNQCQHGSWYFLPWHRGYLLAFEAQIRKAVTDLGGPANWALPYWNYFKPGERQLPQAFASPNWPDGDGNNPLYVAQRYGPADDRKVYVPPGSVNLSALRNPRYTGSASGGNPGFGGVDTGFAHSGVVHGALESEPHDWVHTLVGGGDPTNARLPGLMSDPDTAGLDPIFWLHHSNIDRLWEVWRRNAPTHHDPVTARWANGPTAAGDRHFVMPMPDGTTWTYTPRDMTDLSALNYSYDDLPAPPAAAPAAEQERTQAAASAEGAAMAEPTAAELVGASPTGLRMDGGDLRTQIRLDAGARQKVASSFAPGADTTLAPDAVYLNLENVRGQADSTALNVFVSVPGPTGDGQERLAGRVALFGVRKASSTDQEHAGQGLTFVLDITDIAEELHLNNALDADSISVRIAPFKPISPSAELSIGRVSIYREGS